MKNSSIESYGEHKISIVCTWTTLSVLPHPSHFHETSSLQITQIDIGIIPLPQPLQDPLLYNRYCFAIWLFRQYTICI